MSWYICVIYCFAAIELCILLRSFTAAHFLFFGGGTLKLTEESIMKLYVEIAKRAKNNNDREAWLALRALPYLNIHNDDETVELMSHLEKDENIISIDSPKISGHCCLTVHVNQDFIDLYDI